MAHKDLDNDQRHMIENELRRALFEIVHQLWFNKQSLALGREHLINIMPELFDSTVKDLPGDDYLSMDE